MAALENYWSSLFTGLFSQSLKMNCIFRWRGEIMVYVVCKTVVVSLLTLWRNKCEIQPLNKESLWN